MCRLGLRRSTNVPENRTTMATAAFETPKLKSYPVIPLVQVGAMSHLKPFVANGRFKNH
jgi:hypothetical protein